MEDEDGPHCRVADEVHVPLAVARLYVAEPVPLLGQRPERLGEERERLDGDRQLAGPRPEHLAGDADEVAAVEVGESGVVLAQLVRPRVELDPARVVHQVREARLAVMAQGDDATGQAHGAEPPELRLARVAEPVGERARPMGHRKAAAERIDPSGPQRRELLVPRTDQVAGVAVSRLRSRERSFWHWTRVPVGRWVMRTAESAVLPPWPPGPEDRKTSTRISSSRTLTSTSSTSGTTEADAKLVCRRREASNGEIRTSRCTPVSPLSKP